MIRHLLAFLNRAVAKAPAVFTLAWLLAAALGIGMGAQLPGRLANAEAPPGASESGHAAALLKAAFPSYAGATHLIVVPRDGATTESAVKRAEQAIGGRPGIRMVRRWPDDDGTSASVLVAISDPGPAAIATVQDLRTSLARAGFSADRASLDGVGDNRFRPRPIALVTGAPAAAFDVFDLLGKRLGQVERVSLVISAILLVYVFGSWLLAGLALVSGLVCLAILPVLLVGLSYLWPVTAINMAVAAVISLALGLDYPLLLLSRFRQEWNDDVNSALERTLATAGGTLITSGAVMVAGGLSVLLVPLGEVRSVALTMVFSSLLALALSLTFIPAALRILAARWDFGPFLGKRQLEKSDRYWRRLAAWVTARPRTALTASLLLLVALAVPALQLRTWSPYVSMLPDGLEAKRGLDMLLEGGHGGLVSPLIVLWKASIPGGAITPAFIDHMRKAATRLEADQRISRVESVGGGETDPRVTAMLLRSPLARRSHAGISPDGSVALMRVVLKTVPDDPASAALVGDIRAALARAPFPNARALLGGMQAEQADIQASFSRGMPAVLVFNLLVIPLILAAAFRSVILPIKAVLTNLLPVLAGLGVVVMRFQGIGGGQWPHEGYIQAMSVAIMLSLLFAISMDYEIFLLSRIREAYDDSGENRNAVISGLGSSGRVVIGAALVLLSVFVPYLFVEIRTLQELGTGLSVATLLDATIVRLILVPSALLVLGNWNYWVPGANRNKPKG